MEPINDENSNSNSNDDSSSNGSGNSSNRNFVFLAIAAVVAVLLGVFIFFSNGFSVGEKSKSTYADQFKQGSKLHENRSPLAETYFENAVRLSTSAREESRAKIHLGTSILLTDVERGISVLKEVVADERYPLPTRAAAGHHINEYFLEHTTSGNADFIFQGETWVAFRNPGADSTPAQALYEWISETLHPIYQAEYWLSMRYGRLANRSEGEERLQYVEQSLARISSGDQSYADTTYSTPTTQQVQGLLNKGLGLSNLFDLGFAKADEVELVFLEALQLTETDPDRELLQIRNLFGRMYYARFLAKLDPVPAEKVQEILKSLTENVDIMSDFMKRQATRPINKNNEKYGLIELSKHDPALRAKLVLLGWTEDNFVR